MKTCSCGERPVSFGLNVCGPCAVAASDAEYRRHTESYEDTARRLENVSGSAFQPSNNIERALHRAARKDISRGAR